jgi:hypothetical protein
MACCMCWSNSSSSNQPLVAWESVAQPHKWTLTGNKSQVSSLVEPNGVENLNHYDAKNFGGEVLKEHCGSAPPCLPRYVETICVDAELGHVVVHSCEISVSVLQRNDALALSTTNIEAYGT